MKLTTYARQTGISSRTAWRWFKAGKLPGDPMDPGPIIVTEPTPGNVRVGTPAQVALDTRVAAAENKYNLDGQAKRLQDDCAAQGYRVAAVVKEIGSGVNDTRPKLLRWSTDPTLTLIGVEHKDRLTRFGFHSIEPRLKLPGRRSEVIQLADNGPADVSQDVVTLRVVTSGCARW